MKAAERFLDVGASLLPGTYRVALMVGLRCDGQALLETAPDVAACAALMGLPVLTSDDQIIAACRALGVATALPPPCGKRRCNCEEWKAIIGHIVSKGKNQKAKGKTIGTTTLLFAFCLYTFFLGMIATRSHLIRAGRGRTRVLRLRAVGHTLLLLPYTVAPGQAWCRVCGCTELLGCSPPCAWVDLAHTVCSRCFTKEMLP